MRFAILAVLLFVSVPAFAECPLPNLAAPTKSCGQKCQEKIYLKKLDEMSACDKREWQEFNQDIDAHMREFDRATSREIIHCYPDSSGGQTCYR